MKIELELTTLAAILLSASALTLFPACKTSRGTGALVGAGVGAVAGQALGGDTEATVTGAAVGAAGGYVLGNENDKGGK